MAVVGVVHANIIIIIIVIVIIYQFSCSLIASGFHAKPIASGQITAYTVVRPQSHVSIVVVVVVATIIVIIVES